VCDRDFRKLSVLSLSAALVGWSFVNPRLSMAVRELPAPAPGWALLGIPVGTVRAEEAAFRAALATGVGGWLFGRLADRSGSLAAPMLVHLAINEAGAMAALIVQRRSR
jgi:membrane protease YdiL (CAAX protease family)